jgi:protein O-mannosyl-transferase
LQPCRYYFMPAKTIKKAGAKSMGRATEKDNAGYQRWAPLVVVLFTGLLYIRSLQNNLTSFDDDFYITNNPFLKDFSLKGIAAIFTSFYSSNYHPLTTLTWFFEYHLFGINPLPYHLVNVLLHLVNTWLVYKLVSKLSGNVNTALIVSLLFGIHPMHVESVAWVSERKDVLYAAFYLSALMAYVRYIGSGLKANHYTHMMLLFIASLLSKSAAVTLPALLIVIDVYKGRGISVRSLLEKVPLFLLSAVFGILAVLSQKEGGALSSLLASYGLVNGIFLFTSGLAFYIIWLAAPFSLSAMHYFPNVHDGWLPWPYYLSLPFLFVIAWLIARPGRYRREVVFGFSFFLVVISVMLQVVSVGSALTAERYSYVASIGLFYFAAQWLSAMYLTSRKNMVAGCLAAVVVIFSVETWNRVGVWKEDALLFENIIDKNPDVYYGYWLRGNLEKQKGDLQAALKDYSQCIILNPKFEDAYYNRGIIYDGLGDIKSALLDFNQSIILNPRQADALNNRGWILLRMGNVQAAMADYNQAININSKFAEAYNNRGWALESLNDSKAALADYEKASVLKPDFAKPVYNKAALEVKSGDFAAALADYNYLLKLNPGDNTIYYMLGIANHNLNNNAAACGNWQQAAGLGNSKAQDMLRLYCH